MSAKTYKEYKPIPILQPYIDCYWFFAAGSPAALNSARPITPDGCADIIFDLTRPSPRKSFIAGTMTHPFTNLLPHLTGVRFRPGMAGPFFNAPISLMTDTLADCDEFFGKEATFLSDQLVEAGSVEWQLSHLNRFFLSRLPNLKPVEAPMKRALDEIQRSGGHCSVRQLSEQIGWSRQYFTKKCRHYTGLGPKFLLQALRIQNIIRAYDSGNFHSWSDLSLSQGFYDQSHLINEFRKMTGLTPMEFFK